MPYLSSCQTIAHGPVFVWPTGCGFTTFLKVAFKKNNRDQKYKWLELKIFTLSFYRKSWPTPALLRAFQVVTKTE